MTAMHVTHLVPAPFDPEDGVLGGAERYSFELARHMAERVPTELVTFGARARCATAGALRITVLEARYVRGQRSNPISAALWRALSPASVVHCHQQHVLASSLSALAARTRGRRVFATDLGGGGFDVSGYISTDRWYHGHLHVSEFSRRVAGHEGSARARVILGGVDAERFSPGAGKGAGVLFVGRLLPHKGIHDLLDAMPAGVPLRIAGQALDPTYAARLKSRAADRDVTFLHDLGDDQLVAEYRRARCVVLPSVHHTPDGGYTPVPELLGQTLLEGMACGRPVVCTDVASLPEVVVDGDTGFVVPAGNAAALRRAIETLHADPARAARMGEAGRRRVLERFRWGQVVERCLDAYETLPRVRRSRP